MVQAFALYSGPFVLEGLDGVNSDEYSSIHYGTAGICSWVPHGRKLCVQVRAGTEHEDRRADLRNEGRARLDAQIPPQEPGTLRATPHANVGRGPLGD